MAAPLRKIICHISKRFRLDIGCSNTQRCFSISATDMCQNETTSRDPEPYFLDPHVQNILKKVTGFDIDKIFNQRLVNPRHPTYKLVSARELQQLEKKTFRRARGRIQMPPVMKSWNPKESEILSEDPEIAGHDTVNYVFTDICYGLRPWKRAVVVREPNGILRTARPGEKQRMLQTYFPLHGRHYNMPKMFEHDHLERLLQEEKYRYVLDRACAQFEPSDPNFIRVCHRVYEQVNSEQQYEVLRSTRHFGGLTFYLAWHEKVEGLMTDMIQRELVSDASDVVRLFHVLHPDCQSVQTAQEELDKMSDIGFIQNFLQLDSRHGGEVELALQAYIDNMAQNNVNTATS